MFSRADSPQFGTVVWLIGERCVNSKKPVPIANDPLRRIGSVVFAWFAAGSFHFCRYNFLMHGFVRNFITEWRSLEMPFRGETVIVAVSGGADSVSLLLALDELRTAAKLDLRIVAAHFNHHLRDGESDADEEFVRRLTSDRGIELAAGHAPPPPGKGNLEQNARIARYDFLKRTADNLSAYAILTGHTVNDQAETFLMNLIRGSGREGLCGIRPVRNFEFQVSSFESSQANPDIRTPKLKLARPLLNWAKRTDTEGFCRDLCVEYRYDTMNEDTAFRRVRIRKILLPLLEDFNPNIIETLANTAHLMQNLPQAHTSENHLPVADELNLADVRGLSRPVLYETIRSWLRQQRGNTRQLQLKHIEAIERLILSIKSGKHAELPGGRVTKTGGKLIYNKNKVEN